jgi:hypothetical protein
MRFFEGHCPRFSRWVAVVGLVALSGCGALDPRPDSEIVRERVQERWNALIAGNLDKAYGYITPTSRSVISLENYKNSLKTGTWKAVAVENVDCASPTVCQVELGVTQVVRGYSATIRTRETWMKDGYTWWYVYK